MTEGGNDRDFRMTPEEMEKFEKAFKDKKFRELLVEYANEISDPENRKKYEEEIAQMERERGSDIKFVNPEGGFVVKTKRTDCDLKMFVNICFNEHIKPAKSTYVDKGVDGKRQAGYKWDLPYSLTQGRDDLDRAGNKCVVYDAVFHPDTYRRGEKDPRFRKVMIDTALDGLETRHGIKMDKTRAFGGANIGSVLECKFQISNSGPVNIVQQPKSRRVTIESDAEEIDFGTVEKIALGLDCTDLSKVAWSVLSKPQPSKQDPDELAGGLKFPYPYSKQETQTCEPEKTAHTISKKDQTSKLVGGRESTDPTQPRHRLVHRGHVDLQNFTNARDSNASTRPRELVIYIDLPLLKSAAPVELDIFEKRLSLDCKTPPYHLDLVLPYPVDEENGSAKFDKSKCQLVVTVPVQPPPAPPVTQLPAAQAPDNTEEDERTVGRTDEVTEERRDGTAKRGEGGKGADGTDEGTNKRTDESTHRGKEGNTVDGTDEGTNERTEETTHEDEEGKTADGADEGANERTEETTEGAADLVSSGPEMPNGDLDEESEARLPDCCGTDAESAEKAAHQPDDNSGRSQNGTPAGWPNGDQSDSACDEQTTDDDIRFELPTGSELPSPFFKCPPYTFHQDEDAVVFVVNVPRVALETVSLGFNANKCYISFPSASSSLLPDYTLYIQFPDGHNLDPDLCKIDVSEKNLVLTLHKDESCKGLWESFRVGPGEDEMEDRCFVSEENVQRMMEEIAQQDPWASPVYDTNLKVTSVKKNLFELELQSKLQEPEKSALEGEQTLPLDQAEQMADASLSSKMDRLHLDSVNGSNAAENGLPTGKLERSESERSTDGEPSCTDEGDDHFSSSELVARSIRMRKSCLRRTSSTSTDDEVEMFTGSPDSPSKNVRFNLNHQIRVFSNKKDKKKRRLEQRIKSEAKKAMERAKAVEQEGGNTSGETEPLDGRENGEHGTTTSTETNSAACNQPVLTNNLIFELDD